MGGIDCLRSVDHYVGRARSGVPRGISMDISELNEQWRRELDFFNDWNHWRVVEARLRGALEAVAARDRELLEDNTGERSIAHRLAVWLEHEFGGWHVDCEFNRQGDEGERITKRVRASADLPESRAGQGSTDVTPDIIVHQRRKRWNLLAIEVKPSDSDGLEKDRAKLRAYLTDDQLRYAFAVLVTYSTGREAGFAPIERIIAPETLTNG